MKRMIISCRIAFVFFACALMFQGCLKDTATRTYTLMSPVYKSTAEIRAGIKSNDPAPISKAGKIVVLDNYIYLNEVDKGIHIIDNTDPSAPVNKYFIAIPGNLDLAVKGNTLYADLFSDLVAIDISNPSAAALKKVTKNVFPPRQYPGFFIQDTTRVIVDWIKKDTTVGVDDQPISFPGGFVLDSRSSALASAQPGGKNGVNGSTSRFTLLNNYLYAVTDHSLNVFDVSQPENPVFTGQKGLGWRIETISTFKGNLFIGSQTGVYIFSTANPAQPTLLSTFSHATMCDPVIADDKYAYVTLHDGTTCRGTFNQLDILDISNLNNPRFIKTYPLTNPQGLSKDGNTLFICDGRDGLKIFDATDVNNIQLLQIVGGINAIDIIAIDKNAIVVTTDGLYQFDYSNNRKVTQRSKISYPL